MTYVEQVQPDLEVKVKPSMHQRKLAEAKAQRLMVRDELWARRRMHDHPMMDDDERMYVSDHALYFIAYSSHRLACLDRFLLHEPRRR